jgi:hypothetical protein
MRKRRTTKRLVAAVTLGGALLLGACSGGSADRAATTTTTTPKITSSGAADDTTAMCAVFQGIAARAAEQGGQPNGGPTGAGPEQPTTEAGWAERVERTAQLVETAPDDYRDEAETYLQLVKDRAQLAADNGYALVEDLPADVRNAFIADHRDEQLQANALIAFAKEECDLL